MRVTEHLVDDIPVTLILPDAPVRGLVLWTTHLGGSASKERPTMTRIAERGYATVGFDPPLHGRRATGDDPRAFATATLAEFRLRMWPVLGRATLEAMRVLTWSLDRLGPGDVSVAAGGVSMGGDIAVALAGVDDRVRRVAAVGSTPNWRRPDMRDLADAERVIDQGTPDRYAQWFADHLDPATHLDCYRSGRRISFEMGGDDRHVPVENAEAFGRDVSRLSGDTVVTVHLHPGLDHFGVTTNEVALATAVAALTE